MGGQGLAVHPSPDQGLSLVRATLPLFKGLGGGDGQAGWACAWRRDKVSCTQPTTLSRALAAGTVLQ